MNDQQTGKPASRKEEPRAFVQASGVVFQVAGLVLLLGGCCIGSFSGLIQGRQATAAADMMTWLRESPTGQVLATFGIVISGVAGLALMVFGLGLQHARRRSGLGALVTTAVLAVTWWSLAVLQFVMSFSIAAMIVQLLLAVAATILFLLAGAAHRSLRMIPREPDEPVTAEFLSQFERRPKAAETERTEPPRRQGR